MLRGLDASAAARSDYEPPVVRVAGREPLDATATVYVHGEPTPAGHRRLEAARDRLELLEDAGVLRSVRAVAWPARLTPTCESEPAVRSLVRSCCRAAGPEALAPWFDLDADAVAVPELALVLRQEGVITDLYPRRTEGGDVSVETGLERLCAGRDREPLTRHPEGDVSATTLVDGAAPDAAADPGGTPLTPP